MKPKKILLISLERSSPVNWTCYGNQHAYTPELNRLTSEAIVYYEHYAATDQPAENWRSLWASITEPHAHWMLDASIVFDRKSASAQFNSIENFLQSQSDTRVGWVQLTEGIDDEAKSVCPGDDEPLQPLEALIGMLKPAIQKLIEQNLNLTMVLTAGAGILFHDQEPTSLLTQTVTQSLTACLWTPLIIWNSARSDQEFAHVLNVTSPQNLGVKLQKWLEVIDDEFPADFEGNPSFEVEDGLLLQTDDKIGYRTQRDLLVVNRQELNGEMGREPPPDGQLYYKPEDRFDVNDMATTEPERVNQLWQQLHHEIKKAPSVYLSRAENSRR